MWVRCIRTRNGVGMEKSAEVARFSFLLLYLPKKHAFATVWESLLTDKEIHDSLIYTNQPVQFNLG